MSQKIIGIDLGGTSIKFAILTQEGEIQEKWSIKTNILDEGSHIVDDMIESIQHRLNCLDCLLQISVGLVWVHLVWLTVKKELLSVPTTSTGKLFNQSKKRWKKPWVFHSLST